MRVTLKIWRQPDSASPGEMVTYELDDVSEDMSFLEMLDVLNEGLTSNCLLYTSDAADDREV